MSKPMIGTVLIVTAAITTGVVVHLSGQSGGNAVVGNFTNAGVAEVKDAQGQVVLQGQFANADESSGDIERKAILKPTGIDADAAGEAEVEFAKANPSTQEIEFSVSRLEPGVSYSFFIDGQAVASATTDRSGKAEVEFDVKMSSIN